MENDFIKLYAIFSMERNYLIFAKLSDMKFESIWNKCLKIPKK